MEGWATLNSELPANKWCLHYEEIFIQLEHALPSSFVQRFLTFAIILPFLTNTHPTGTLSTVSASSAWYYRLEVLNLFQWMKAFWDLTMTMASFIHFRCSLLSIWNFWIWASFLVLLKFSPKLMQWTGTDRTEPKVQFSLVLILQFWLRFSSRFWEFSKIPKPFENRSKFSFEIQKKACKTACMWCINVIIGPICWNKAVVEFYWLGFWSLEWLVIPKYSNSLSISCFLALVPSKSIWTKKFKHKLHVAIGFKV